MKKYILLLFIIFMFIFISCGTDFVYSSFYIRNKDLQWYVAPSEQASVNSRFNISVSGSFKYTSPSIVATPDNYILSIYEYRYTDKQDIIGIDNSTTADVYVSISLNAESFVSFDQIVGNSASSQADSHGSPIAFVDKNGNVVVLAVGGIGFSQQGTDDELTPISVSISEDNGKTWSKWADIDTNTFKPLKDKGFNRYYTNPGNGKRLRNGTLACIIDYRDTRKSSDKHKPAGFAILYSANDGKDWQIGATMSYSGSSHRFARIIAENSDGTLLIAAVPNTVNDYNAQGNLQWYKASSINGMITDFPVSGLLNNCGGTVSGDNLTFTENGLKKNGIILAHTFPNRSYKNPNGLVWDVTNGAAISISEDGGASWTLVTNIIGREPIDVAAFRQSLSVLRDGTIVICYEEGIKAGINSSQKMFIAYKRVSLESLSKGKYKYEGL